MQDSYCVTIYIFLWAVTFFLYLRKKRTLDAGGFIIGSYLLYAILSYFLYVYYFSQGMGDAITELNLFPFIYLFSMLLIFLLPVLKYNEKCIIQQPSSSIINVISSIYLIAAIVVVPVFLERLSDAIFVILTTDEGGDDLYYLASLERGKESGFSLYNIFAIVFNVFSDFAILLFFYSLTLPHIKKRTAFGLLVAIVVSMLKSLATGGRTGITMTLLICIASFFLFKYQLPHKYKKVVGYIGGLLVFFVILMIITIGKSKFSSSSLGADYQLLNYSSQAPLMFNKYGLDAGDIRYGDRTCTIFKKLLLFEDVPTDFDSCRQKHHKMKLDDSRFSTFVGDFCLDFGPVTTAIIFCFVSFFIARLTRVKDRTILFHQLILIYLIMCICITGGMYLFYYSFKGNYTLIGFIILYFIFKYDYNFQIRKKKSKEKLLAK